MTDSTPADDPNTNGAASVQALVQAEDAVKETKADPPADIVSEDKAAAEESTAATAPEETAPENGDTEKAAEEPATTTPIVSQNKKSRPPYKYDPNKVTLRFLFANRDGLTVTLECNPSDTVSEVKGALLSVWPEGKPPEIDVTDAIHKVLGCYFAASSNVWPWGVLFKVNVRR